MEGESATTNRQEDRAESAERGRRAHLSRSSSSTLTRDVLSYNSGNRIITIMQAAESGNGFDPAICT
jgi:hypothetical protein